MVITSEEVHHRRNRGYNVEIVMVINGVLKSCRNPGSEPKQNIKNWANDEQWEKLKKGSGGIAALLRIREAVKMGMPWEKI